MTTIRSTRYKTAGDIIIYRASVGCDYLNSTAEISTALDQCHGALFSSGFEFPGRYTRWDVGFTNPPLMLQSYGRQLEIVALNERGQVLLAMLDPVMTGSDTVAEVKKDKDRLVLTLVHAEPVFFEEERSRQITVFSVLREIIKVFYSTEDNFLGLYGAFGYELAFQFEEVERKLVRDSGTRDLVLYLPDEILVVDHQKEQARRHSYDFEAEGLTTGHLPRMGAASGFRMPEYDETVGRCDHQAGEYAETVRKARQYFARGDLFEAVPGQLFQEPCIDSPSCIFERLKTRNPSPYGAFINLGEEEFLVAASPEMYVRVEQAEQGLRVETCPISGTIARGTNAMEDAAQVRELLNSLKDESELSMCTDVDRNDKSRICVPGSVQVIGRRQIEMYSRLIHTVDHVEGIIRPEFDALDAFLTHMWAVTVTGAPKQSAIQFIEDHEKSPRRWYGGAMGFLKFNGEINTGLTLRTIRIENGLAEVRAGATLLFDSDPEAEEAETRLKASALLSAIRNDYPVDTKRIESCRGTDGKGLNVLMVDHQDSFVHTLSAYFQAEGAQVRTVRPELVAAVLEQFPADLVVLSPGPGRPADFRLSETLARCVSRNLPVFGVCLGLQGIVEYFGGTLKSLDYPMHGKASVLAETGGSLFAEVRNDIAIGRYHSLVAADMPSCLKVTARTADALVMAIEHESLPISAVQFHPESILSLGDDAGVKIIRNVLRQVTMRHAA